MKHILAVALLTVSLRPAWGQDDSPYRPVDPQFTQKEVTLRPLLLGMLVSAAAWRCHLRTEEYSDVLSQAWYNRAGRLLSDGRDVNELFNRGMRRFSETYPDLGGQVTTQACERLAHSQELQGADKLVGELSAAISPK